MEDLPFGILAALVTEFAVKDLPLGRTLMTMIYINMDMTWTNQKQGLTVILGSNSSPLDERQRTYLPAKAVI